MLEDKGEFVSAAGKVRQKNLVKRKFAEILCCFYRNFLDFFVGEGYNVQACIDVQHFLCANLYAIKQPNNPAEAENHSGGEKECQHLIS